MSTEQAGKGILEDLYLADFARQKFDTFKPFAIAPGTEEILRDYADLITEFPPARLEQLGTLPEALWRGLKKIGIFGLNIPKKYGGAGLALDQYLKVLETMARQDLALALIPTAHLSIGLKGILLFGSEEQKKKYLPSAASGDMIFAYALTEPKIGSDAQHIEPLSLTADMRGD
jgi:acyl-CoA dehydrogenase family protein 9